MANHISNASWLRLSEFVAEKLGLHFPPARWVDLQRGLANMAKEAAFPNTAACVERVLQGDVTKEQVLTLACHLTVGETYFFREKRTFEVLAESVLPDLIRLRRSEGSRRLRFWSAACCTGEEAYSLAILLHQLIPDLADWNVTVFATDINQRFLKKAVEGVYGEWSFRESPPKFRENYFRPVGKPGLCEVIPEIKKLVAFAPMNLVEDFYPITPAGPNAIDIILCRNALMYFTPAQAAKVVKQLHGSLIQDGWLAVSPCEASQTLFSQFTPVNFPGVTLYRNEIGKWKTAFPLTRANWSELTPIHRHNFEIPAQGLPPEEGPRWPAASVHLDPSPNQEQDSSVEAAVAPLNLTDDFENSDARTLSVRAKDLANQGELTGALHWCDRWVAADKLDATGHYLRAVIMQELGDRQQSRYSLQRVIYLRPDFILAHFALGHLARMDVRNSEADKCFSNALRLLEGYQIGDILPESDGLTAGRLKEIILATIADVISS